MEEKQGERGRRNQEQGVGIGNQRFERKEKKEKKRKDAMVLLDIQVFFFAVYGESSRVQGRR